MNDLKEVVQALEDHFRDIRYLWERSVSPKREVWFSSEALVALIRSTSIPWTKMQIDGEKSFVLATLASGKYKPDLLLASTASVAPALIGEVKLLTSEDEFLRGLGDPDDGLAAQLLRWQQEFPDAVVFGVLFLISGSAFKSPRSPALAAIDEIYASLDAWSGELTVAGWRKTRKQLLDEITKKVAEWDIVLRSAANELTEQTEDQLRNVDLGMTDYLAMPSEPLPSGLLLPTKVDGSYDALGSRGSPKEERNDASLDPNAHREWAKVEAERLMKFDKNGFRWFHHEGFREVQELRETSLPYGTGSAALSVGIIRFNGGS